MGGMLAMEAYSGVVVLVMGGEGCVVGVTWYEQGLLLRTSMG